MIEINKMEMNIDLLNVDLSLHQKIGVQTFTINVEPTSEKEFYCDRGESSFSNIRN